MTATDRQVEIVMRELKKGRTQEQAAAKANLQSRQTVSRYARLGKLPSQLLKQPRQYRTRPDPFTEDWPEIERRLNEAPELEAKTLFAWLCEQRPDQYQEGQLRTFQRHVSTWRALNGSQLLSLPQVHVPGEVLQTDGTHMHALRVTIAGEPFPHLLIHCVLPYSNWEWGRVSQSESLMALQLAVYSTIAQLGYIPAVHQTDHSTAATHHLGPELRETRGAKRAFNEAYLEMLKPLAMQPRTINLCAPNENGDAESAQGAFKRAVEQHLLLRGHRDFADVAAWETFLWNIMLRRNELRRTRLAEEVAVMRPLAAPLPNAVREYTPRVGPSGIIRVLSNSYSVPSGLVGRQVTARVSEWQIEVWYAGHCALTISRLKGNHGHDINFRHVIDTLLRKPGGFRHYRYRDDLFPEPVFRRAWEALCARLPERQADLAYLRILKLAAGTLVTDVAAVLETLLSDQTPWDDTTVQARFTPAPSGAPELESTAVDLNEYDDLLAKEVVDVAG